MDDPTWLRTAREWIGQREVPGPASNSWIKDLWHRLRGGAWFWKHYGEDDSKLPWCGAFCAAVFDECGMPYPKQYASALAWRQWGEATPPRLGALAVLQREGGGHVGFVTARSPGHQYVQLLGGNQGDAVSLAWFPTWRVVAYRKPLAWGELPPAPYREPGKLSESEA